nr:MAG TPA: hypothetical protein [Caudoviricetes sp.]
MNFSYTVFASYLLTTNIRLSRLKIGLNAYNYRLPDLTT